MPTSGLAIASLICSCLAISCWGVTAIPGVICGHLALREIDRSDGRLQGRGLALAGTIVGWIFIGLAIALVVLLVILAAASEPSTYD